jgi:uncharacterized protein (TIGR03790 family)
MKKLRAVYLISALFAFCMRLSAQETSPEAAATLVVFNSRDPLSEDLARYYAEKRHIPADQVVSVSCTIDEGIQREDYDRDIAEPLRKIFNGHDWWKLEKISDTETQVLWNKIRFVALIRGIPLRIFPTTNYTGDKPNGQPEISAKNEASVDSELASLGYFTHVISGALNNPYFHKYTAIADAGLPQLMLVCRLDAPTGQIVKRMIDDAIETEKKGLWGFAYIDSRNIKDGGLADGDRWLDQVAADAKKQGFPVIHDNGPGLFPDDYPMNNAALYYGWYAENVTGPFLRPDFRFNQGAIACHIHSFSAETLRDPTKKWCAPMLSLGATAVLGNVFEPFLALTPNLDIFHERLRDGFTFAESAYMSGRVVSWMGVCVGDPLYRPFKVVQEIPTDMSGPTAEWLSYRTGAQTWFTQGRSVGEKKLKKSARDLHSGIIYEGLGLLQADENDFVSALDSFQEARRNYTNGDDIIRTALHELSLLRILNKKGQAHAIATRVLQSYPAAFSAPLLRKVDLEMNPPPTPVPQPQPSASLK